MQPAFYYATLTMLIAMVSSLLLMEINSGLGARWRSALLVLPMVLSLAAALCFLPSLTLYGPPGSGHSGIQLSDLGYPQGLFPGDMFMAQAPVEQTMVSITAALVIMGLVLAASSLIFSVLLGDRLARRLLKVVDLSSEDYPQLRSDMAELAMALGIRVPKLGLVEDLRPNAFTIGRGKGTTVVFSLGILELLDRQELRAVAAHELSHVRNHDVWFRTAIKALAWVQFFNLVSHLSVRAAQREREKLADDTARSVLSDKGSLLSAIEKVTSFLGTGGRRSLTTRLGLCFALSFSDRASLMSDHPSLADRARSFTEGASKGYLSPRACLVLSIAVLLATTIMVGSLDDMRSEILHLEARDMMDALPVFEHHMIFQGAGNVTAEGMDMSMAHPGMQVPFHPINSTGEMEAMHNSYY